MQRSAETLIPLLLVLAFERLEACVLARVKREPQGAADALAALLHRGALEVALAEPLDSLRGLRDIHASVAWLVCFGVEDRGDTVRVDSLSRRTVEGSPDAKAFALQADLLVAVEAKVNELFNAETLVKDFAGAGVRRRAADLGHEPRLRGVEHPDDVLASVVVDSLGEPRSNESRESLHLVTKDCVPGSVFRTFAYIWRAHRPNDTRSCRGFGCGRCGRGGGGCR